MNETHGPQFLLCINNEDYPASLEVRKLYRVIPDPASASRHFVRIVDESGEDYLYPEGYFIPLELPQSVEDALLQATSIMGV
jgi:hypothetical protein